MGGHDRDGAAPIGRPALSPRSAFRTEHADPAANLSAMESAAASIVNTLRTESDSTLAVIAASAACGASRLAQMMKTGHGSAPVSVARAALLPQPQRLALAQLIAGDGHMVAELPASSSDAADLDLVMRAQRESGDVITAHLAAIRDGRMCRAEGVELEREVDEAIAVLLTVRARARLAQKEIVIGVPLRAVARGER